MHEGFMMTPLSFLITCQGLMIGHESIVISHEGFTTTPVSFLGSR